MNHAEGIALRAPPGLGDLEEWVSVELTRLSQLVDVPSLHQTHYTHPAHQATHEATPARFKQSINGVANQGEGAGNRRADQDHGSLPRWNAAEEHQARHQKLRAVEGVHGKEDIEEEQSDVEGDGACDDTPQQCHPLVDGVFHPEPGCTASKWIQ